MNDKRCLITGISSDIGFATAEELSVQGWKVFGTGRKNHEIASRLNEPYYKFIRADLSNYDHVVGLFSELEPLDGLVLNAGFLKRTPIRFLNISDFEQMLEVNYKSNVYLINSLIKNRMLKDGSSVVFIGSMSAIKPTLGNSIYASMKAAISSFSKSLALELAPKAIRVNTVLPGLIETKMTKDFIEDSKHNGHLSKYPLNRFGSPKDVSGLVTFLLSEKSEWLTGTEIPIDGGYSIA